MSHDIVDLLSLRQVPVWKFIWGFFFRNPGSLGEGYMRQQGAGDWKFKLVNVVSSTLLETNISHTKACLKMMFLFPRWDMLVP